MTGHSGDLAVLTSSCKPSRTVVRCHKLNPSPLRASHRLNCGCVCCSNDDYVTALTDGAFNKLLQIQLVRKIEGEQFFGVSL